MARRMPRPRNAVAEAARPLGLYVDPAGQTWRVSWNPNATALHEARNVQLFVREKNEPGRTIASGDDQNPIDLSARDLASGSYQYRPTGNDVTFRLEVTDQAGRVSAESFRIVQSGESVRPRRPPRLNPRRRLRACTAARIVQPKATYRAPPVVAAGIRSRIKGTIPIDVRVHIDDSRTRRIGDARVTRPHSGIDEYLAAARCRRHGSGVSNRRARMARPSPARRSSTSFSKNNVSAVLRATLLTALPC